MGVDTLGDAALPAARADDHARAGAPCPDLARSRPRRAVLASTALTRSPPRCRQATNTIEYELDSEDEAWLEAFNSDPAVPEEQRQPSLDADQLEGCAACLVAYPRASASAVCFTASSSFGPSSTTTTTSSSSLPPSFGPSSSSTSSTSSLTTSCITSTTAPRPPPPPRHRYMDTLEKASFAVLHAHKPEEKEGGASHRRDAVASPLARRPSASPGAGSGRGHRAFAGLKHGQSARPATLRF